MGVVGVDRYAVDGKVGHEMNLGNGANEKR